MNEEGFDIGIPDNFVHRHTGIPEDLFHGEQGRTSQSIPVVEQLEYVIPRTTSQSIPVVEQSGYVIPRTSQSGSVVSNHVFDPDPDAASDDDIHNLDPALSRLHNNVLPLVDDHSSGSDEEQAENKEDDTSKVRPPVFIENQQKRTKYFNTYREHMQRNVWSLGIKTGCYGFLYLRR
jgi:hypothetical protein